jgi:SAM-dependent methyltransferase
VVRWSLPPELEQSSAVAYRNRFADQLASRPVDEVLDSYAHYSVAAMERLVCLAERYVLDEPLAGVGIELGAGTALLSSVIARREGVRAILALEVCEGMCRHVVPKVAGSILGDRAGRIVPVVGSFDDLHLPDGSLDFAVEIGSLHHSNDLARTCREAARVLRPGGTLLCFDRCHPNSVTDAEVEALLGRTYSREFLVANGYPPDIVFTRRQNGEHEYRLFEWQGAFAAAGLEMRRMVEFRRPLKLRHALGGLLSLTGRKRHKYRPAMVGQYLRERLARLRGTARCGNYVLSERRTTVFALAKGTASAVAGRGRAA